MKTLARLIAWNWYIVRKMWLLVCIVMTVGEVAVLLLTAGNKNGAGTPYEILFLYSFAWLIFAVGYLATMAVALRPLLQAQGKSRGAYTLQTLPAKRGTVLYAQMACTGLALCGTIAWQLLLTWVMYWPVTAVNNLAARALPLYTVPHADMQLSFVRNVLVRTLLPTTPSGVVTMLLCIAAPSVLLVCAFFHKGGARFWAICMGVFGAGCCAFMLLLQVTSSRAYYTFNNPSFAAIFRTLLITLITLALMAAAILWALRSIRRAAWL